MKIGNDLYPQTSIRRYIGQDKLFDFLLNRRLFIRRADGFCDQFEAEYTKQLCDAFNQISVFRNGVKQKSGALWRRERILRSHYISCWTLDCTENMALWRLYGASRNCVAIETKVQAVADALDFKSQIISSRIEKIRYIDHFTHENYRELLDEHGNIDLLSIKNVGYRFEHEARIIYCTANHVEWKSREIGIFIDNIDIEALIGRIIVSPDAEDFFFDSVQSLLAELKIKVTVECSDLRTPPRAVLS